MRPDEYAAIARIGVVITSAFGVAALAADRPDVALGFALAAAASYAIERTAAR